MFSKWSSLLNNLVNAKPSGVYSVMLYGSKTWVEKEDCLILLDTSILFG